jgi:hypothetical protein
MGILLGIGFVAAAMKLGGWEWALIGAIGLVLALGTDMGWKPAAAMGVVGLVWLVLFQITGDSRLFFPYSMQYAVQVACLLKGRVEWPALSGGGGVVAVFALIRFSQQATLPVLAVELVVAAFVLGAASAAYGRLKSRVGAAALGSVLAFAGLIF